MRFDQKRIAIVCQALWKGSVLSFAKQDEMIKEVVAVLTLRYQEYLTYWQITAVDDRAEYQSWGKRIKEEVEPYYDALEKALQNEVKKRKTIFYRILLKLGILKNEIKIGKKHTKLIQQALSAIGSPTKPSSILPSNVLWKLDLNQNQFQEIIL